ncbi:MAG: hypothetical protein JO184_14625 [Gammaproteobacteria bacterium]|nr:hypothetical protein [Gammaproteobacteria bacterium]MBV8306811.1 hypothetical protein [Gammaproteobacteria bacterium]MBV8402944.1 hypothetical protein [Gammaproteobacteria bacterium]
MRRVKGYRAGMWTALMVLALAVSGCSHWPWHKQLPPAPRSVHYLEVSGSDTAAVLAQYWKRNTLVVDLTAASGTGSITLRPPGDGWPVRVALRVTPGAVGELDVRGGQRVVLPIVPGGVKPVELQLPPAIYTAKTPEVAVAWGPAPTPTG